MEIVMTEPSVTRRVMILVGLFVSFSASLWLVLLPVRSLEVLPRLGFISAAICSLGLLVFCWAAPVAHFARKWKWSPRACYLAGLSFVVPVVVLSYFAEAANPRERIVSWIIPLTIVSAGYLSRKLAYPELTDEEATAPEPPPSLFPK
jgi:hypothetical protein